MVDPCGEVRRSCALVSSLSKSVIVDEAALRKDVEENSDEWQRWLHQLAPETLNWAQDYHFVDPENETDTAQYVLVLDALNFCFWPLEGYEYEHLASSLTAVFRADRSAFAAENLAKVTEQQVRQWLTTGTPFEPSQVPLASERARLLREVGSVLSAHFNGLAKNLIERADGCAVRLVDLVTSFFPAFRDHAIYQGHQVFFYKRAQIFVGDVWGAFGGQGLGALRNIERLTCFPDYRIPQLLLHTGGMVLRSEELRQAIAQQQELPHGGTFECELRAATIHAVELLAKLLGVTPVQIDWALWERGEAQRTSLPPHHRVLSIFY
ncbi:MAG: hypothetical protein MHM6MM_004059 [Cercozoa sp. M6MM]